VVELGVVLYCGHLQRYALAVGENILTMMSPVTAVTLKMLDLVIGVTCENAERTS
jgi:hypothetical protein